MIYVPVYLSYNQPNDSQLMIQSLTADISQSVNGLDVTLSSSFLSLSLQISPLSSSPGLSDTSTFSTFTRVASSDEAVAVGVVNLMVRYNWTRVSVISMQERIFTSVSIRRKHRVPVMILDANTVSLS